MCPELGLEWQAQFLISCLTRCGCNHSSQVQGGAFFFNVFLKGRHLFYFDTSWLPKCFFWALNICFTNGNVSITATEQTFALGSRGQPYPAVALLPVSLETAWFMRQLSWRTQIKRGLSFRRKTLSERVPRAEAHSSVSWLNVTNVPCSLGFSFHLES